MLDITILIPILLVWLPLLASICSQPPPQPPGYPDDLSGLRVVPGTSWAVYAQARYVCLTKREVRDRPNLGATCVGPNR